METLPGQFDDALTLIEVNGAKRARAIEAHVEVRTHLETSTRLRSWGVDTVLIGSYARRTAIYPGNDVDVFTRLTELDTTASADQVFAEMCELLTDHYGSRATPQNRSVKIGFPDDGDGFSVDVVPAVRHGERWAIPEHDRAQWSHSGAGWVETDPEQLSELTTSLDDEIEVTGRGAYVPVVKLMRQTRSHHRGDQKPSGLYIELTTYEAFKASIVGESFGELFAAALSYVAMRMSSAATNPVLDPALGTPYSPAPAPGDAVATAALFSSLAQDASTALGLGRCEAAIMWRRILGTNARGQVFPLPPGCDETGKSIGTVTANLARGSNEARGFA